jgi:hypothetical protein
LIYGANGLLGGVIKGDPEFFASDAMASSLIFTVISVSLPEPVSSNWPAATPSTGIRDDWDNWFGSDSGRLLHYPIPRTVSAPADFPGLNRCGI